MKQFISSESVTEGHPDKLCDQISDGVLDAILAQDPEARVAVETLTTTGLVVVAGEVTTSATVDVQDLVRSIIKEAGYTDIRYGIDADHCAVLVSLHEQAPDIAQGVDEGTGLSHEQGAGDQGLMYGYATDETDELMPLPISLAHKLTMKLAQLRQEGTLDRVRPDGKSQVTVEYEEGRPVRVDAIVISTQHDPDITHEQIVKSLKQELIDPVVGSYIDDQTKLHINPTGRFVIGGPHGDAGLTGRKIIVDTYGGIGRHGGGAFSGKDPSKVDRSAAYMARYIAKNIVAAGLASKCEVQLSYAIGVAQPVSIHIDCFGSEQVAIDRIIQKTRDLFDLSPKGIIEKLQLKQPIYLRTATYGHFGHAAYSREGTDSAAQYADLLGAE